MLNETIETTLKQSEILLQKLESMQKFAVKYNLTPTRDAEALMESMQRLSDTIPVIVNPQNNEQLIQAELKRRLRGESANLERVLSGRLNDFDTVVNLLGIPSEDIDSLRPWLETNKERTQESVDRLFQSRDLEEFELPLAVDIPGVRRQAEEFTGAHIQRYHKTLGKFLQGITKVGAFLREVDAVPTTHDRSYFNALTNTLAISIPAICFSKVDGSLQIRDKELIRIYGHEGMGHALNYLVTSSNGLPQFLTQRSYLTISTIESIAQFYENVLLEDLKKSPETQRALGIEHKFREIYQEAKDTEQVGEFNRRLSQYVIQVLGDKSLGEPSDPAVLKRKAELLYEVAIDKSGIQDHIQSNRYSFDSEGNLNFQLVQELKYCARPVERALEEFSKQGIIYDEKGRSIIDSTFLNGLWTPIGFVDNARIVANEHKNK